MGLATRHMHDLGCALVPLVAAIGERGLPFDRAEHINQLAHALSALAQCDMELLGVGLTALDSPRKLAEGLTRLGVPLTKRTEKGTQLVTDYDTLRRVHHTYNEANPSAPRFPWLPTLLRRKKLEKARANLESMVACADGRLRTSLKALGTVTGRYSSSRLSWCRACSAAGHGTNLQNVGKPDTDLGVNIRGVIRALPGHVLLERDYNALELRLAAHRTGCRMLLDAFAAGRSPHLDAEMALFGTENVNKTLAKNYRFASLYHGSAPAIQRAFAAKGIFEEQAFIRALMARDASAAPELAAWHVRVGARIAAAQAKGEPVIARNAFGRARVLLGDDPLKEYLNFEIQSTAADVISLALLRMDATTRSMVVGQIHDALLLHVPAPMLSETDAALREAMERPTWLWPHVGTLVALPTEGKIGETWGAMTALP